MSSLDWEDAMQKRDPEPAEREWYSHRQTGDRGWLVERDGRKMVHLDRKDQGGFEELRPFDENSWEKRVEPKVLIRNQAAQIAWAADRQLMQFLGKPQEAKMKWLELHENKRIAWVARGPGTTGARQRLFDAIMGSLERITEKQ
jgi:hypothetical protein